MTAEGTQTRTVVVERELPFPPNRVWRALTEPHLMAEWLMKTDFAPVQGHRFTLRGDWGGILDCEVLEIEPPERLVYSWVFPSDDPAYRLDSVVSFTLTPIASGTHLRVEQTGFAPDQKQAYGGAHAGWKGMLGKLADILAGLDG
ncbi:SRPBCC domain-containing protein [Arsenicitalea aurantiaca]|uniref:SRPBCC domain-containing protein n=1 Tax=Arsenicitalea aurantiaca TaxID=1783274 RepID=A0A433XK54_9HYPH|nr:SRPBCC domain-containing protein [Arsenicitalea aurantiaca]RUT34398.1 SRPBCC domain-containing protein [Arsenicitalea aurantiaca]